MLRLAISLASHDLHIAQKGRCSILIIARGAAPYRKDFDQPPDAKAASRDPVKYARDNPSLQKKVDRKEDGEKAEQDDVAAFTAILFLENSLLFGRHPPKRVCH